MKSNPVREKLKQGKPSIGTWLTLPCTTSATLMSRTGFDWLTMELEHSPTSFETAAACFSIISGQGKVPLVRVPWNTGENIKRVLDTGAWGVVVPMVNTRAEAEAVVEAARYAPIGRRSIGGSLHAANFQTTAAEYYTRANEQLLVVVMVETVEALENLDAIVSVPGIDAVFIGPNDLHNSLSLPPSFESDDPRFKKGLEDVLASAKRHGVAPGIHVADEAMARRRMADGFQFIAVASEAGFMISKAGEITKALGISGGAGVAKY